MEDDPFGVRDMSHGGGSPRQPLTIRGRKAQLDSHLAVPNNNSWLPYKRRTRESRGGNRCRTRESGGDKDKALTRPWCPNAEMGTPGKRVIEPRNRPCCDTSC